MIIPGRSGRKDDSNRPVDSDLKPYVEHSNSIRSNWFQSNISSAQSNIMLNKTIDLLTTNTSLLTHTWSKTDVRYVSSHTILG